MKYDSSSQKRLCPGPEKNPGKMDDHESQFLVDIVSAFLGHTLAYGWISSACLHLIGVLS